VAGKSFRRPEETPSWSVRYYHGSGATVRAQTCRLSIYGGLLRHVLVEDGVLGFVHDAANPG
jgi:hypothetical protein